MECVATLSRQERLAHKVGFAQKWGGGEPNGGFWGGQCTTRLRTSTYHTGAHAKNHIFNFLPARYIYIYIYWLRFFKQSMIRKVKLYWGKFSGFRSPQCTTRLRTSNGHRSARFVLFDWTQVFVYISLIWIQYTSCFPFFLSLSLLLLYLPQCTSAVHRQSALCPTLLRHDPHLTDENLLLRSFQKKIL